jgi:hypothetical protein
MVSCAPTPGRKSGEQELMTEWERSDQGMGCVSLAAADMVAASFSGQGRRPAQLAATPPPADSQPTVGIW